MPKTEPFEKYFDQYEDWFVQNQYGYRSEIDAIRSHLPAHGTGLEIGADIFNLGRLFNRLIYGLFQYTDYLANNVYEIAGLWPCVLIWPLDSQG